MSEIYNHEKVEEKWKKHWESNPINVDNGKNQNITA